MKTNEELISIAVERMQQLEIGSDKPLIMAMAYDKNDILINCRFNSYKKTHPLQKHFAVLAGLPDKIYLHAEISCLVSARKQVETLVIIRLNKNGTHAMAKPCPICQLAIETYDVKRVVYTENPELEVDDD